MENDTLHKLWETQGNDLSNYTPKNILTKAKKQRTGQFITITVLSVTALVLIVYTIYFAFNKWNSFNLGLAFMISSLIFRIILEYYTVYKKESQLVLMNHKAYLGYLKKYYKTRLLINYIITPICIILYIIGFYMLLPYFKEYLSKGFYTYIVISGIVTLLFIVLIIVYSIRKEQGFLKQLNK